MNRYILFIVTCVSICVWPGSSVFAENGKYDLLLRTGQHSIDEGVSETAFHPVASEISEGRYYRLLQFFEIPRQTEIAAYETQGIRFLEYIPNNAYYVSLPQGFKPCKCLLPKLRAASAIRSEWKMTEAILHNEIPSWAVRPGNAIGVNVKFFTGADYNQAVSFLVAMGFSIVKEMPWAHIIEADIKAGDISTLAGLPFINFIENIGEPGYPENYSGRTQHRSSNINSDHPLGMHFDGSGVSVMLQDDGILGPHIDYQGRITQLMTGNSGNHGDHTGGTIMSAGNRDPLGRGMAPGADLYVYEAAPVYQGFSAIPTDYGLYSIRISSTSYSDGCNAGYTAFTQALDEQIRSFSSLSHVFSAGNNGTSNCGYGAGSGWGNITGGHKMGKNVVTVANLSAMDVVASSSSRGPAHDGRIKPELASKGTSVYSTIDPDSYDVKTGTSMACPGVAGTFAQLYHAFRSNNNGQDPDGGLIKAIAMNTAEDLGNPGPDFIYGFGRINALRAVRTIENQWYFSDNITQGQSDTFTLTVPAGLAGLRVMVYWSDFQGSPAASKALVNNLDMSLIQGVTTYTPWVLNVTPNAASLNLPAVRGIDSLNNVEQVTLVSPVAGNYQLVINGTSIPMGPQKYYVVYYFVPEGIEVTYPNGGESWVPGQTETIRWDATGTAGNFSIEYSDDGGQNYTSIITTLSGTTRSYAMSIPSSGVTAQGKIRISRGVETDTSDFNFTIIGVPSNIQVLWACPDSIGVSWNAVTGADYYVLHKLGAKYMDSVAYSLTNSGVITGVNAFDADWLSVSARPSGNGAGRRAVAIEKPIGIFSCPSLIDVQMVSILSPSYEKMYGCQDLDSVPFQLLIRNNSMNPLSNIPVRISVDGGPVQSYVLAGPLAGNASVTFSPAGGVDLSAVGTKQIKAWVDLLIDGWRNNDTIVNVVEVISGTPKTLPWVEDFQNFSNCNINPNCQSQVCVLINGFINQQNLSSDDIDWITDNNGTYSSNTGPTTDHTSGTIYGKYLYTEASGDCNFMRADLVSPCIDLTSAQIPVLTYWYHMYGANMGELHVDLMMGGVWHLDMAVSLSGNQGNEWKRGLVDLSDYRGNVINLRFRGVTGNGYLSDMAIDDISIVETVGLSDPVSGNEFSVFPNPSQGLFNVVCSGDINDMVRIQVYDVTGRLILEKNVNNMTSTSPVEVDLSNTPQGVYQLKVLTGDTSFTTPLVKLEP